MSVAGAAGGTCEGMGVEEAGPDIGMSVGGADSGDTGAGAGIGAAGIGGIDMGSLGL